MTKLLLSVVVAGGLFVMLGGGHALAAHCFIPEKPVGAGEQGVFFNLSEVGGPDVDVLDFPCNPGQGLVCEEVDEGIFVASVPDTAHNAGPGDNECDGKGIDDLFDCPAP